MARFTDKVAVVIGAGGSIGAESARLLAREGAKLVVADVDGAAAEAAARSIVDAGGLAKSRQCDISDEEAVKAVFALAIDSFGGVDLMHANAADTVSVFSDSNPVDVDMAIVRRTIDVNLIGNFLCARYAIPEMLKRGGGAMAFTTSEAAFIGMGHQVAYAMTKASLHAMIRNISAHFGKHNIRANGIAPGLILSDRAKASITPEYAEMTLQRVNVPRLGQPIDIAASAAFFLSEESGYINGQVLCVSGGEYYH